MLVGDLVGDFVGEVVGAIDAWCVCAAGTELGLVLGVGVGLFDNTDK